MEIKTVAEMAKIKRTEYQVMVRIQNSEDSHTLLM